MVVVDDVGESTEMFPSHVARSSCVASQPAAGTRPDLEFLLGEI